MVNLEIVESLVNQVMMASQGRMALQDKMASLVYREIPDHL